MHKNSNFLGVFCLAFVTHFWMNLALECSETISDLLNEYAHFFKLLHKRKSSTRTSKAWHKKIMKRKKLCQQQKKATFSLSKWHFSRYSFSSLLTSCCKKEATHRQQGLLRPVVHKKGALFFVSQWLLWPFWARIFSSSIFCTCPFRFLIGFSWSLLFLLLLLSIILRNICSSSSRPKV